MFQYYQPTRIHFGENQLNNLAKICRPYGTRCLLVTTPDEALKSLYERIISLLHESGVEVCHFDKVAPNPTVEIVTAGFAMLQQHPADFVLAAGGGSSIDTAKAIAFTNGVSAIDWDFLFSQYSSPYENYPPFSDTSLPLISIPTTSGTGSQVTQAAVISRGKEKLTFYHPGLFSRECLIDPCLMLTLPNQISAATGFDAFTHAFESYINPHASFYSEMDSVQAMQLIVKNLPELLAQPRQLEYRKQMALADTLAGRALSNSGAMAPHPLSEIIGGITHLPHGEALAIVFPAFIKHSLLTHQEKYLQVAKIFDPDTTDAAMLPYYINQFLTTLQLNKTLSSSHVDQQAFSEILAAPVLDVLPFGSRQDLEKILTDSYA